MLSSPCKSKAKLILQNIPWFENFNSYNDCIDSSDKGFCTQGFKSQMLHKPSKSSIFALAVLDATNSRHSSSVSQLKIVPGQSCLGHSTSVPEINSVLHSSIYGSITGAFLVLGISVLMLALSLVFLYIVLFPLDLVKFLS